MNNLLWLMGSATISKRIVVDPIKFDPIKFDPIKLTTNVTGFTALPAGIRYDVGPFENIGRMTGWWSSSVASPNLVWNRGLDYLDNFMDSGCVDRRFGYSIRCIKD